MSNPRCYQCGKPLSSWDEPHDWNDCIQYASRLSKAAPDLLEALRSIASMPPYGYGQEMACAMQDIAIAAIEKMETTNED